MFKALICNARHKAKWLCLGYNKDGYADWQCTQCDRQWASKDLQAIACVGCVRLFHTEGLNDAPLGERLCAACEFSRDYKARWPWPGPDPRPAKRIPTDKINADTIKADKIDGVQLIAPQTIETEYGAAVMTPPGTPYYPPGKDMGLHTGGAFHFTGKAPAPKPAEKVQPSDSSYSNLPHPRAILRGRTATEGE